MASAALSAFQTLLSIGDGESPEVFTTIAELRNLSGPSFSADVLDATTHNTPTPFRRFISGLIDGGEISVELNFIPTEATHDAATGILNELLERGRSNYQIQFPDEALTTWTIPGIVTAFELNADPADILTASVTVKVAGPPTLSTQWP